MNTDVLRALETGDWSKCTVELASDIFRIQIFEPLVSQSIYEELIALDEWATSNRVEVSPPNSMHHYGVETHRLGFANILDDFVRRIADGFARIFP